MGSPPPATSGRDLPDRRGPRQDGRRPGAQTREGRARGQPAAVRGGADTYFPPAAAPDRPLRRRCGRRALRARGGSTCHSSRGAGPGPGAPAEAFEGAAPGNRGTCRDRAPVRRLDHGPPRQRQRDTRAQTRRSCFYGARPLGPQERSGPRTATTRHQEAPRLRVPFRPEGLGSSGPHDLLHQHTVVNALIVFAKHGPSKDTLRPGPDSLCGRRPADAPSLFRPPPRPPRLRAPRRSPAQSRAGGLT